MYESGDKDKHSPGSWMTMGLKMIVKFAGRTRTFVRQWPTNILSSRLGPSKIVAFAFGIDRDTFVYQTVPHSIELETTLRQLHLRFMRARSNNFVGWIDSETTSRDIQSVGNRKLQICPRDIRAEENTRSRPDSCKRRLIASQPAA
jgi:hypothetical protein